MTRPAQPPAGATPPRDDAGLTEPTLRALFFCALAALALLWLPLTVLQLIDGLLFLQRPAAIGRDLALLWPMVAVPAAVLALLAWLVRLLLTRIAPPWRDLVSWTVLLVPVLWMCAWQSARTVWLWIRVTSGTSFVISAELRMAIVVVMVLILVGVWQGGRAARIVHWLVDHLLALRTPTLVVLGVSLLVTLVSPPELLGSRRSAAGPVHGQPPPPDILLITVDTLAAEDAGACGDGPTLMPNLRRLASTSTCFTRFYASSNFTTPTTSTMETGALPWSHLAVQPDAKIVPALRSPALADLLRGQGYRTYSVTDNLLASPRHRGTHRGYDDADLVHTTLLGNVVREAMTTFPDTSLPQLAAAAWSFMSAFDVYLHGDHNPYESERTFDASLELLQRVGTQQPVFLWAQTLPPHSPYLPPRRTKYKLLPPGELERWKDMLPDNSVYADATQILVDKHRLRYRESIMAVDMALGEFLAALERSGRLERALLIVTSDHGESFERRFIGHAGPLLHEALIRVPLVVKMPGQTQGSIIDTPLSQADLTPTLLDIARAPALATAEGRSIKASLAGAPLDAAPVFSMALEHQSRFAPLREGRFAVIDGPLKLLTTLGREAPELYDVLADPKELTNLAPRQPDTVARLESLIRVRVAQAEQARRARSTP